MSELLSQIASGTTGIPDIVGGVARGMALNDNLLALKAKQGAISQQRDWKTAVQQYMTNDPSKMMPALQKLYATDPEKAKTLQAGVNMANKDRVSRYFEALKGAMAMAYEDPEKTRAVITQAMNGLDQNTDWLYIKSAQEMLNSDDSKMRSSMMQMIDHGAQLGYIQTKKSLTEIAEDRRLAERGMRVQEGGLALSEESEQRQASNEDRSFGMREKEFQMKADKISRAERQLELDAIYGKVPKGYRRKEDGSVEPISGSKDDIKRQEAVKKHIAEAKGIKDKAANVISKVDKALEKVGAFTAGPIGAAFGIIPGTPARNLEGIIDTIKANISFDTLQQMRMASPTGGALGSVSERELKQLERAIASLDRTQSPTQLISNLKDVKRHYENWALTVEQHLNNKGMSLGGQQTVQPPTPPTATNQPMESQPRVNNREGQSSQRRIIFDTQGNIVK